MAIIIAMTKILLAMALGFFLYKIHILNEEANETISKLVIYGAGPAMIFSSVASVSKGAKSDVVKLVLAGLVMYIVFALLSFLAAKLMRTEKRTQGTLEAVMMYGNSAFMAFPIGQALFGDIGTFYMAILNIHANVGMFSYGIYQITKGGTGNFKFSLKKLLNPGIIAAIIAVIFYFANISVPSVIMGTFDFVGQLTAPAALIVMGSTIATYALKNLFIKWRYYVAAAVKLLIMPLVVYFLSMAAFGAGELVQILAIHAAMPTATVVSMLALTYGGDYETTTSATGLMNIFCMATIPIIWRIVQ